MGTLRAALIALALGLIAWLGDAQMASADELIDQGIAYKKTIADELSQIDPEAARLFDKADDDYQAKRVDDAIAGFEAVRKLAPNSPHPLRRLCRVLGDSDRIDEAIDYCRQALAKRDDGIQKVSLALALLSKQNDNAAALEAFRLADKASGGEDGYAYVALCEAELRLNQPANLDKCTEGLMRVAPHSPATYVAFSSTSVSDVRATELITSVMRHASLALLIGQKTFRGLSHACWHRGPNDPADRKEPRGMSMSLSSGGGRLAASWRPPAPKTARD